MTDARRSRHYAIRSVLATMILCACGDTTIEMGADAAPETLYGGCEMDRPRLLIPATPITVIPADGDSVDSLIGPRSFHEEQPAVGPAQPKSSGRARTMNIENEELVTAARALGFNTDPNDHQQIGKALDQGMVDEATNERAGSVPFPFAATVVPRGFKPILNPATATDITYTEQHGIYCRTGNFVYTAFWIEWENMEVADAGNLASLVPPYDGALVGANGLPLGAFGGSLYFLLSNFLTDNAPAGSHYELNLDVTGIFVFSWPSLGGVLTSVKVGPLLEVRRMAGWITYTIDPVTPIFNYDPLLP